MTIAVVIIAVLVLLSMLVGWSLRGNARSRIRITLGQEKVLEVSGGDTLMNTLAREGVVLPSTCGGKGSCAQCRCRIVKGGGRIAERERPYFNRTEVRDKWRLACQVIVHDDMVLDLPQP